MYLLGYDIGSSSVKAAILDASTGECVASDFFPKTEAPIKALHPGWAEQKPDDWWNYVKKATAEILNASHINPTDIKAIGISYQMHGLVVVDKSMRPLRDAIIWCDSRAVKYGEQALQDLGSKEILTNQLNSPGNFTASKLAWVKEHEPEIFEKIYKVILPGEYIAMKMTGEVITTPEGLSEQILWDFKHNDISESLLSYFGFSKDIFAEVRPTFSEQGRLTSEAALELGLMQGIPITYRAGDQPNNALSLNVFNPGEIASTAGTSGVIYGVSDKIEYDAQSRVNSFAHVNYKATDPRIGILACINGTGILNSWIKKNVAPTGFGYEDINGLAATAPVGSGGVTVLPFGNGAERLLGNVSPGASIHGVEFTRHGRQHLVRAAQEGIVFAFVYGIEIMKQMGLNIEKIHAAKANMFLSQVFRDTLASTSGAVIKLYHTDGAIGAALGAGIGAKIYADADDAFTSLKTLGEVLPAKDTSPYVEAYEKWKNLLIKNIKQN